MGEKRIEEMKREYEEYPVSEEALNRIMAGIAQAEKEKMGMKSKIYRFVKTTGISTVAAMAAIAILANSGEHIARAMEQIPVIGSIAKVVTFRSYSDTNGEFEANVNIPQISEDGIDGSATLAAINKGIEEYAEELIGMYEKELQESGGEGRYKLDSSYEVICNDERYLAIRINTTVVMAGGNQFVKIFNIDKETGTVLTLEDICCATEDYVTLISENIKEQMRNQMEENEEIMYFIYTEEEPFGFETVTEKDNFYLNENRELVVVFDEYEVAPGSMGVVEFTIPRDIVDIR